MFAAVKSNFSPRLPDDKLPFVPDLTQQFVISLLAFPPVPEYVPVKPDSDENVWVAPSENCNLTWLKANVEVTMMDLRRYVHWICGIVPDAVRPLSLAYCGVKVRLP